MDKHEEAMNRMADEYWKECLSAFPKQWSMAVDLGYLENNNKKHFIAGFTAALEVSAKETEAKDQRIKELEKEGAQLSAGSCVHPESLAVDEEHDHVFCRIADTQNWHADMDHDKSEVSYVYPESRQVDYYQCAGKRARLALEKLKLLQNSEDGSNE